MIQLFHYLVERLKGLFLTDVALDVEAQFLTRDAERKADLLRRAAQYEEEGLLEVAKQLREQATGIRIERPLASVVPAIGYLQNGSASPPPALPASHADQGQALETGERQPTEGTSTEATPESQTSSGKERISKRQPSSQRGSKKKSRP